MHYPSLLRQSALVACFMLPLLVTGKEKKKSYNVSAFGNFQKLPVNAKAGARMREKAHVVFPGWMVATDKLSGMPVDMNGAPIAVPGADMGARSSYIVEQKLSALGIVPGEWLLSKQYAAPKASYVNYRQLINGHDVVFSSMNFRFTKAGDLARIELKTYGEPAGGIAPQVSIEEAKTNAVKDIEGLAITLATVDANWSWFPIPHEDGYTLHPAWHFKVTGKIEGRVPQQLQGYVDAITGEVLYRTNDVKETNFDLTVKGMVYKNGTLHPATLEPLTNLHLSGPLGTMTTDTNGFCNSSLLALPITPDVALEGDWSTVYNYTSTTTPHFATTVSAAGTVYTFPATSPSSSRHVNAYYHVNRVHNFMKSYWPTFTDMDFSLPTNVDVNTGSCNAYYDGTSINFYTAGSGCTSFAEIGDIIYHEYGHGISDHFYTSHSSLGTTIQNGSLNEACSDVWAMSITRNPILGENSFVPYQGFIRRYDISPQVYPADITTPVVADPHYTGQIIAGCWWDVGVNMGSTAAMTQLFTDVYYDVPDGPDGTEGEIFHSILVSALLADDDDANLTNGTPHYTEILKAFARHGIYLEGEASIFHTEVGNPAAGAAIPVSAVLNLEYPTYMSDFTLYYRVNGTGAWSAIPMTGSGSYSCTIPAQTAGTIVEYYFVVHDALGKDNAYFPLNCNPNLPPTQATLPYQFGVGLLPAITYNFEGSATNWTMGLPTDDATDGTWTIGTPLGYHDASFPFNIDCFAFADHTSGFGDCLMAGLGGDVSTNTSVSEGTTTLLSPIFDIGSYNKPVFEYWRWFCSEFVYTEVKNDPWITQIRDATSSANPWQTVERTYRSDLNWRRKIVDIKQYLPAAAKVQMRFLASDSILNNWNSQGQSIVTADIDDFSLRDNISHVGVADIAAAHAQVNPNPADNVLNVLLSAANTTGTITLYDVTGRVMGELKMNGQGNKYTFETSDLSPGIYNLVIRTGERSEVIKVVVGH